MVKGNLERDRVGRGVRMGARENNTIYMQFFEKWAREERRESEK